MRRNIGVEATQCKMELCRLRIEGNQTPSISASSGRTPTGQSRCFCRGRPHAWNLKETSCAVFCSIRAADGRCETRTNGAIRPLCLSYATGNPSQGNLPRERALHVRPCKGRKPRHVIVVGPCRMQLEANQLFHHLPLLPLPGPPLVRLHMVFLHYTPTVECTATSTLKTCFSTREAGRSLAATTS